MRSLTMLMLTGLVVACGGNDEEPPATTPQGGTPTNNNDPDADGDGFPRSLDCNDNDQFVNPDAVEVCDGVDTDCNDATEDSGVGTRLPGAAPVDRTADFDTGSPTTPYQYTISEAGELNFCGGEYFVNINVTAEGNVRIAGQGSDSVELDGGGVSPGIVITGNTNLRLQGLTLTNFVDAPDGLGSALHCNAGSAVINASDLRFVDNSADVGGAMAVAGGCSVAEFTNVEFTNNTAATVGGHLAIAEGDITEASNVRLSGGSAPDGGGAIVMGSELSEVSGAESSFRCRQCTFENNDAKAEPQGSGGGGAVWIQSNATMQLQNSAFTNNESDGPGGAVLLQSVDDDEAELTFQDTQFDGNTADGVSNAVSIPKVTDGDYDFDGSESQMCDEVDGCTSNG